VQPDGASLNRQAGVICAVLVRPSHRRRGIGRELVARAEAYLRRSGSTSISAGQSPGRDPFYVGIYGGSQPTGFLESDRAAHPFFTALGHRPAQRWLVQQRGLSDSADPMSMRLLSMRRATEVAATDHPQPLTWWWTARFGRLDTVRFLMVLKGENRIVATMNIVDLSFYASKWGERVVGLTDLFVPAEERRHGYGQALLVEVCRRLREESVGRVEMHVLETDAPLVSLLNTCGFEPVDVGVVYVRA
jgi:GNAT superfamily N-acetyltransferase